MRCMLLDRLDWVSDATELFFCASAAPTAYVTLKKESTFRVHLVSFSDFLKLLCCLLPET